MCFISKASLSYGAHKNMQKFIRDQQSWQNVSLINGNHFSQEQVFHSIPLVYAYK